jgi:hypothetical protein
MIKNERKIYLYSALLITLVVNSAKLMDFIYFKSSTINGYNYATDHAMPSSRKAFDALDYFLP